MEAREFRRAQSGTQSVDRKKGTSWGNRAAISRRRCCCERRRRRRLRFSSRLRLDRRRLNSRPQRARAAPGYRSAERMRRRKRRRRRKERLRRWRVGGGGSWPRAEFGFGMAPPANLGSLIAVALKVPFVLLLLLLLSFGVLAIASEHGGVICDHEDEDDDDFVLGSSSKHARSAKRHPIE